MSDLKPCPFCGGEVHIGVNKESTVREYFVDCLNCHIRLYKIGYKRFYTEAEAIAAWNSRAERTCKVTKEFADIGGERMTDYSCCLNQSGWGHNYCPNCGRRVVGE